MGLCESSFRQQVAGKKCPKNYMMVKFSGAKYFSDGKTYLAGLAFSGKGITIHRVHVEVNDPKKKISLRDGDVYKIKVRHLWKKNSDGTLTNMETGKSPAEHECCRCKQDVVVKCHNGVCVEDSNGDGHVDGYDKDFWKLGIRI